jgi:hypothetical protein
LYFGKYQFLIMINLSILKECSSDASAESKMAWLRRSLPERYKILDEMVNMFCRKEASMINDVVLEGIIVRTWKFADDLLFRLACYRDPDLPQKPLNETKDAADFVTVRVTKSSLGAPVAVQKGLQVRVHGFLQSRDYKESLADFLRDAHGADLPVPDSLDPLALTAPRGTTEVIARRIMHQPNNKKNKGNKEQ